MGESFLPKTEFHKHILTLLTGSLLGQLVPVIVSPLFTRIYKPEDFGLLAIFTAASAILSIIATGRYELAIILPEDDKEAAMVFIGALGITTVFVIFLFLLLYIVKYLMWQFNMPDWWFLIPVLTFFTSIYQIFNYWQNRKKRYKEISQNRVIQALCIAIISIMIGFVATFHSFKNLGLVLGQLGGLCITLLIFCFQILKKDYPIFSGITIQQTRNLLNRYSEFPKLNLPSSLFNTASTQAPTFLLSYFFDSLTVGYHSLSNRLLNLPMTILGNNIGQVFYQKASQLKINEDLSELQNITLDIYKQLLKIGSPLIFFILFFGKDIFAFAFGSEWATAGIYTQLQSIWFLFVFISSPLSSLLIIFGKQKKNLWLNIILLLSRISVIVIGGLLFKDPFITFLLYGTIGAIIWILFTYYLLSLLSITYKTITKIALRICIPSFSVCLLLFIIYKVLIK